MLYNSNPALFMTYLNEKRRHGHDIPLHLALENVRGDEVAIYYISMGADLSVRNKWKKTPLEGMHHALKEHFYANLFSVKKVNDDKTITISLS